MSKLQDLRIKIRSFFALLPLKQIFIALVVLGSISFVAAWVSVQSVIDEWSPVLDAKIRSRQQASTVKVLARNAKGEKEWLASIVGGRLESRKNLVLAEVNPLLLNAIVELEDSRFLEHGGFDLKGIARAALTNLMNLSYREGASTLTQQLVKNLFLTQEKTFSRKFKEVILSILVEKKFQKEEILEAYLNEVYMGQAGYPDILGIERAAEFYFGKEQSELEAAEAALLAAIVAGPGFYSPFKHPDRALARRNKVLKVLSDSEKITEEEYVIALNTPLPKEPNPNFRSKASYAIQEIRDALIEKEGEAKVLQGGFDAEVTLDPTLQKASEDLFIQQSASWPRDLQVALVGIDPRTCEYRVYQGGTSYLRTQYNRLTRAKRPPGSLIKPLILSPLLDSKTDVTLATRLNDEAFTWDFDKGRGHWSPQNYDRKFRGEVSLRATVENSLNVPMAKLFQKEEPDGLLWKLFSPILPWGLDIPPERALPSAILGSVEQRPIDMALAYVGLVRTALGLSGFGEKPCDLKFLVNDQSLQAAGIYGKSQLMPDQQSQASSSSVSDQEIALSSEKQGQIGSLLTLEAMQGVVRRGSAKGLGSMLAANQPWAGKTGTSSDKRDAWFVVASPRLVLLAWMGRDQFLETTYTGAWLSTNLVAPLLKTYSKTLPDEGFAWPEHAKLEWKVIDTSRGCEYAGRYAAEMKEKFPEIKNSQALPNEAIIDGHPLAYELFKDGDSLSYCP